MSEFRPKFTNVANSQEAAEIINKPHDGTRDHVKLCKSLIDVFTSDEVKHIFYDGEVNAMDVRTVHATIFVGEHVYRPGQFREIPAHVIQRESGETHFYPDPFEIPMLLDRILPMNIHSVDIKQWYKEFQEIHPFKDGNGRVGGVLLTAAWFNQTGEWIAPLQ